MTPTAHRIAACIGAIALLALAVGNAPAGRLGVNESYFNINWRSLEFTGAATVRCSVRFGGQFHSGAWVKVSRSLIGWLTTATRIGFCTGGEAWVDNGAEFEPLGSTPNRLPFYITYEAFTATLPNITGISFLFARMSIVLRATVLGFTCQGRYGRAEDNITATATRNTSTGAITGIAPVTGANRLSLVEQLGPHAVCGTTVALRGTSDPPTAYASGASLRVVLI